jgi:Flp pilus assembly CpaE family ATPase/DNA-binding NarL/FixJ family response regulator
MEKIKLMVVDDIPQTRKDIIRLLYFEDDMVVVGEAGDGADAIRKIGELQPDVVLMDINMPQLDGIAATERASQLYPHVAIIIISIQGESEYLKKAMVAGARDYLVKPLGSEEMSNTIRAVHKQQRMRAHPYSGQNKAWNPAPAVQHTSEVKNENRQHFAPPEFYHTDNQDYHIPLHTGAEPDFRHKRFGALPQTMAEEHIPPKMAEPHPWQREPRWDMHDADARLQQHQRQPFEAEIRPEPVRLETIRTAEPVVMGPTIQEQILEKYRQQLQERPQVLRAERPLQTVEHAGHQMTGDSYFGMGSPAAPQFREEEVIRDTRPLQAELPQWEVTATPAGFNGQVSQEPKAYFSQNAYPPETRPAVAIEVTEPIPEQSPPPAPVMEEITETVVEESHPADIRQVLGKDHLAVKSEAVPVRLEREKMPEPEVRSSAADEKPLGVVTLVFSGKGGVGTTTIATNLAVVLSQQEKKKVALLDYDLQFGDISVLLNLSDGKNIVDMVRDEKEITQEVLEDYMIRHFSGIDILSAPLFPQEAEYITADHTEKILQLLKTNYDHIIVDTAVLFDEVTLRAMDMADRILLVTTRDIVTIKNTRTSMNILESLNYRDKIRIILNRADLDLGVDVPALEKGLEITVAHQINSDEKALIQAINKGVPVVISQNNAEISKSFKRLCERLNTVRRATGTVKENRGIITRMFSL